MEQTSSPLIKLERASSFAKFKELPPELRIKIWQFAMPEARTVVVKSPYARHQRPPTCLDGALAEEDHVEEKAWQSPTQIPPLLHVNAEARYEALKHYSLSLGVGGGTPMVYVDFDRDTLFFGSQELEPACQPLWAQTNDISRVRRLAVVPEGAWRALRWMKREHNCLEKLVFVFNSEEVKLGGLPQLVEDQQSKAESPLELKRHVRQLETAMTEIQPPEPDSPKKQRIQEARDEFATLKMVLLAEWEREPAVSTAVFTEVGTTHLKAA